MAPISSISFSQSSQRLHLLDRFKSTLGLCHLKFTICIIVKSNRNRIRRIRPLTSPPTQSSIFRFVHNQPQNKGGNRLTITDEHMSPADHLKHNRLAFECHSNDEAEQCVCSASGTSAYTKHYDYYYSNDQRTGSFGTAFAMNNKLYWMNYLQTKTAGLKSVPLHPAKHRTGGNRKNRTAPSEDEKAK